MHSTFRAFWARVSAESGVSEESSLAKRSRSACLAADVEPFGTDEQRSSALGWSVADVAIVLVLVVAAVVARRHVLPEDGLVGDDAWQAFGAMHASPSNLLTVGFSAPGFTAVLAVWHAIARRPESMADVAFAAGVLGP